MAKNIVVGKSIACCVTLFIVLIGCGGSSLNPINPPVVSASGPLPFPTITAPGQTITLDPGTYSCPTGIVSGTHIIGHGAVVPPELITDTTFAPLSSPAAPVVRIVCSGDLLLSSVSGVEMSGVILDFQGTGGLFLDSITYGRFDLGIVNSTVGITMQSKAGNNAGNTFPRIVIFRTGKGIVFQGFNSKAVTWNDFGHVDIVHATQYGIAITQFSDSNTFEAVRIHLDASASAGVVFNDNAVLADVDASGNIFHSLNCDSEGGSEFCADFRGYTVGNNVTMGFGIMPDANKIHFDNAFSQSANIVTKMQEGPKTP